MAQLSIETGLPATAQSTRRIWSATAGFLKKLGKNMQVAQMASVLSNMSDKQLTQIGVTSRSDIWRHAERLVR